MIRTCRIHLPRGNKGCLPLTHSHSQPPPPPFSRRLPSNDRRRREEKKERKKTGETGENRRKRGGIAQQVLTVAWPWISGFDIRSTSCSPIEGCWAGIGPSWSIPIFPEGREGAIIAWSLGLRWPGNGVGNREPGGLLSFVAFYDVVRAAFSAFRSRCQLSLRRRLWGRGSIGGV